MTTPIKVETITLGDREVTLKTYSKSITIEVVGEEKTRWLTVKNMDEEIRLYTACKDSEDQWIC